ncbi:MAG: hypothetical protein JST93_19720 [Acidobacteria bacterium]|nr:hypothetical protein [Acidobacteriota bacterium]
MGFEANGNSVAVAEAKVKNAQEVMRRASKEWEAFTSGPVVTELNSGRAMDTVDLTDLIVGVVKLVRGTASVLAAEQAALMAVVDALKAAKR